MYWISYFKHDSGNYYVTFSSQTIVVLPGFFKRVIRMQGNVIVGCGQVDAEVLNELGFIVPTRFLLKTV
ncbi:hypothetical protein WMO40_24160 [Bacillaceae bacterium CLA-AA-H227]|uniref:Uncharacterized protein n=1 Tax=Robertmurraya yapensis (ex Hitch et al 2024) TaxID=3133160 RepID=A0ACC6SHZ5_9BACI